MGNGRTVQPSLAQWWRERKRKWPWIVATVLLLLFVIAGIFGGEERGVGNSPEEPPAAVIPDGLTGMDAASARDRLEALGFQVTMESVDGRTVIVEGNWRVVSAELREGDSAAARSVVLRVEKPAETTTVSPTTVVPPPVTETPPAEVAPVPEPAPQPEPAPEPEPAPQPAPEAYYANCSAARAAGAAPLTVGEPGYRSGLDRDGDGVACE